MPAIRSLWKKSDQGKIFYVILFVEPMRIYAQYFMLTMQHVPPQSTEMQRKNVQIVPKNTLRDTYQTSPTM